MIHGAGMVEPGATWYPPAPCQRHERCTPVPCCLLGACSSLEAADFVHRCLSPGGMPVCCFWKSVQPYTRFLAWRELLGLMDQGLHSQAVMTSAPAKLRLQCVSSDATSDTQRVACRAQGPRC